MRSLCLFVSCGVPQTYEYLDKMQDRVIKFVVQNARLSEKRFRELMFRTGQLARDIGTVLVGKDAVKAGLIDAVGGLGDSLHRLNRLVEERRERDEPRDKGRIGEVPVS